MYVDGKLKFHIVVVILHGEWKTLRCYMPLPCFIALLILPRVTNYKASFCVIFCIIFYSLLLSLRSKYSLQVSFPLWVSPSVNITVIPTNAEHEVRLKLHIGRVEVLSIQVGDENVQYAERHYPFND